MILRLLGAAFLAALAAVAVFFLAPAWLQNQEIIMIVGGAAVTVAGLVKRKDNDVPYFLFGVSLLVSGVFVTFFRITHDPSLPPLTGGAILWFVVFALLAIFMTRRRSSAPEPSAS
jgi:uncharacterized membrane protein HdeD (DUF308 family)